MYEETCQLGFKSSNADIMQQLYGGGYEDSN